MSGEIRPELAVVIPVYQNLPGAMISLASLRSATWPATGVVILVDDGSEPRLAVTASDWAPLDVRLKRLELNRGIEAALNAGLEMARTLGVSHVARLDAGDTIRADRLSKQLDAMKSDDGVGIVGSDVDFVAEDGALLFRFVAPPADREIRRRMHVNACLIHPAVMMRLAALEKAGNYSTEFRRAEDYDLFFRILAVSRAASIPEPLTRTVVTPGGISVKRRRQQLVSRLRIQLRFFDWRILGSYWGIAVTLVLFGVPLVVLQALKRRLGTSKY